MAHLAEVLHDVWAERERQDIKWGGASHDDALTTLDFRDLILDRAGREPLSHSDDRRLLIEIAALAVAAVQVLDRRSHDEG